MIKKVIRKKIIAKKLKATKDSIGILMKEEIKSWPLWKVAKRLIKSRVIFKDIFSKIFFYLKIKKYKKFKKIIYATTPPPRLRNLGDHAQVIAIKKWFDEYFKDYLVLEFDKDEVINYVNIIRRIVNKNDLIFLQSGGNLGDKGIWSETARRLIINNLPNNKIISLPQTIYFSNTPQGKKELETTKEIYNRHKALTIMARDEHSFKLAKEYFPQCKIMICPDFVLYLTNYVDEIQLHSERRDILLCFREDWQSIIPVSVKTVMKENIKKINENFLEYNTLVDRDILQGNREEEFKISLALFKKHKLVITDRLHGLIFSVISKTPCIVTPTINHKLREGIKWFTKLNYVSYIEDFNKMPAESFSEFDLKRVA